MRKLVFVPILFFASFLLILYVVIPNYIKSNDLQNQIEIKEKDLKEKQGYFIRIKEISDNLNQYQEFLNKIEKALPQKVSLASLLVFFQGKTLGSGLVMENLSLSKNVQKKSSQSAEMEMDDRIKETNFRLIVSGSFLSFENFLRTIEKSSRLIEVASVSFDAGEQSESILSEAEESEAEESEAEEKEPMNFEFHVALKVYSY